ncbi:MAG: hypothetical protein EA402_14510 [Planctomycetota bacterium]|nr:MAG: hypothetical protein EA402_14510 [Planctomycetota bacterium]
MSAHNETWGPDAHRAPRALSFSYDSSSGLSAYQRYIAFMNEVLLTGNEALISEAQDLLEEAGFRELDPRALCELAVEGSLAGTRSGEHDAINMAKAVWYLYRTADPRFTVIRRHLRSWDEEVLRTLGQRSGIDLLEGP